MPSADTLRLGCSDEDTDAGMGAAAGATDQVISNRGELDTRPRGGFSFGNMGRFPFHGGDGHHLQKSSAEILEEKRALLWLAAPAPGRSRSAPHALSGLDCMDVYPPSFWLTVLLLYCPLFFWCVGMDYCDLLVPGTCQKHKMSSSASQLTNDECEEIGEKTEKRTSILVFVTTTHKTRPMHRKFAKCHEHADISIQSYWSNQQVYQYGT